MCFHTLQRSTALTCSMTGSERARTASNSTFQQEFSWIAIESDGVTRKRMNRDIAPQNPLEPSIEGTGSLEVGITVIPEERSDAPRSENRTDMPSESPRVKFREGCLSMEAMLNPLYTCIYMHVSNKRVPIGVIFCRSCRVLSI